MSKEEVIKQAWVEIYGIEKYELIKHAIKKDGYIDCVRNDEVSKIIDTCNKNIYWGTTNYRPKSLEGIETNYGWIKIEDDLPKETCQFWVQYTNYKNEIEICRMFFFADVKRFEVSTVTDWQPIITPHKSLY